MATAFIAKRLTLASFLFGGLIVSCSGAEPGSIEGDPVKAADIAPASGKTAFRGALGYGAASAGGRGGQVMFVTTLADSGPGSLRACIEASEPRVCIFRVNGVIRYTQRPPRIRDPFITIAGQTAPGGGITLAHSGGSVGRTPLVIKNTHDVVVRHLRIRADRVGDERGSEDTVTIENSQRVIVDHLSGSWARDEIISGYADNDDITISNSIFAWGIPRHDKCTLLSADPRKSQRFTFVGNLCAHNGDRNPDINFTKRSCVEVFNNVFYNAQSEFAEIWESYGGTPVSVVGNTFIAGPDTRPDAVGIVRQTIGSTGTAEAYFFDNRFVGKFTHVDASVSAIAKQRPSCSFTMMPADAESAYEAVLSSSGAFPRDGLDRQVVQDVRTRKGGIMRRPGAIPAIAAEAPYPDKDADGIDDTWEERHGSDPAVADPWEDADGDGTANLEQFLDDLSDAVISGRKSW